MHGGEGREVGLSDLDAQGQSVAQGLNPTAVAASMSVCFGHSGRYLGGLTQREEVSSIHGAGVLCGFGGILCLPVIRQRMQSARQ